MWWYYYIFIINYYIFNKTESNPTINNVLEAKKEYIKNNCSAIIAFGGGSPIDLAKILGASIVTNKPINKMKGLLKIRKKLGIENKMKRTLERVIWIHRITS